MCILSVSTGNVKDLYDFCQNVVSSRPYWDETSSSQIEDLEKDLQVNCDSLSKTGVGALQGLLDKLRGSRTPDHSLIFLYRETPGGRIPSWESGIEIRWGRQETAYQFVAKVVGDPEDLDWDQPLEIRLDLI